MNRKPAAIYIDTILRFSNPEHWNPKKEEIKAKILMHPADKAKFNKLVAERKAQITDMYNAAPDKSILTSAWLKAEMKKIVSPDEPEVRPIYEVMSSHSARRAFSGNMYDKVQDLTWSVPLPVTKRAASPSPATAR